MNNRLTTAALSSLTLVVCGVVAADLSADGGHALAGNEMLLAATTTCPDLEALRMCELASATATAASDAHHHSDSIGSHHHHDTAQGAGLPAELGDANSRFDV